MGEREEAQRERAVWQLLVAAKAWRDTLIPGTGSAPWPEAEALRDAVDRLWPIHE